MPVYKITCHHIQEDANVNLKSYEMDLPLSKALDSYTVGAGFKSQLR
jgi:hypothetical protein